MSDRLPGEADYDRHRGDQTQAKSGGAGGMDSREDGPGQERGLDEGTNAIMTATNRVTLDGVDLSTCDNEPIHIPGSIQPHGTLLVLDGESLSIIQAAANVGEFLAGDSEEVLGRAPEDLFGGKQGEWLRADLSNSSLEKNPLYLRTVTVETAGRRRSFHAVAHRREDRIILELEPADSEREISFQVLYPLVRTFLARLPGVSTSQALNQFATEEVRRMTGFDRVLIYRFDQDGNGTVIAEDRNERLPSYLNLRFPASDIPSQARSLYRLYRLRLIADASYTPVPIEPSRDPVTGEPLDLGYTALRSVSPVHVQYMKNMGTSASMSISIIRDGELWGLISCHHKDPRVVPFEVRTACDFLGQVLSAQLEVKEHNEAFERRMRIKSVESRLLSFMAEEEYFINGLTRHPDELLAMASAEGAAVALDNQITLLGSTPTEGQVKRLIDWLASDESRLVYETDALPAEYPEAERYKDRASGLLAISISKLHRSFVLWFRPEFTRTVEWGGDPRLPVETGTHGKPLNPRHSFEIWKETVRGRSRPWLPAEVEIAQELRSAIVNIVLRKAEELAEVNEELRRSNKELESFSYSVSHDLRAPLRHVVGYAALLRNGLGKQLDPENRRYIETIIDSAEYAGKLVDNLLSFSQVGRTAIHPVPVNMNLLVGEIRKEITAESTERAIEWTVHPLPNVQGDLMMLRLAFRNLLANAVKYTRQRDVATIEVGCQTSELEHVFFVKDNGAGFDMAYVDKLFGVFQRLHRWEEFEGTGIGLANVRRIAERHRGRTWAEGETGLGATFYFAIARGSS